MKFRVITNEEINIYLITEGILLNSERARKIFYNYSTTNFQLKIGEYFKKISQNAKETGTFKMFFVEK